MVSILKEGSQKFMLIFCLEGYHNTKKDFNNLIQKNYKYSKITQNIKGNFIIRPNI